MVLLTGVVDAISYLALGHVFISNMTSNIAFIGFALAGERTLSVQSTLEAVGSLFIGAGRCRPVLCTFFYRSFVFARRWVVRTGASGDPPKRLDVRDLCGNAAEVGNRAPGHRYGLSEYPCPAAGDAKFNNDNCADFDAYGSCCRCGCWDTPTRRAPLVGRACHVFGDACRWGSGVVRVVSRSFVIGPGADRNPAGGHLAFQEN